MNRGKFWLCMALMLAACAANLVFLSRSLTHRAVDQLDREQRAAATQVDARAQLLAAQAARLAETVARDPATIHALSPDAIGVSDPAAVPQAALEAARSMGVDATRGLLVATAGRAGRTVHVGGESANLEGADEIFPGADGVRREGYALTERGVWYASGVPIGRGAAVVIGVPVDASWLGLLKIATGSDVTLAVDGRKPLSTLPPRDALAVDAAARVRPGLPRDVGSLGKEGPAMGALPLLFARAPALRVHALTLKGTSGVLALSRAAAPLLAPLATYQWITLGALAVLALIGVGVGLLITNEQAALVPKDLTTAADRISRGDFSARAPMMAGSLGTIAAALNRAAEAASAPARPRPAAEVPPVPAEEPQARGTEVAPPGSPEAEPAPAGEASLTREIFQDVREVSRIEPIPDGFASAALVRDEAPASSGGANGEALPTAEPAPAAPGAAGDQGASLFEPPPHAAAQGRDSAFSGEARVETKTEDLLLAGSAPPASPAPQAASSEAAEAPATPSNPEEDHWHTVYQDFLRVRRDCGESAEGVPYQRFRNKLQQNRDHLVAKYGCKSVRFQVYVKEGKAALKASPVR